MSNFVCVVLGVMRTKKKLEKKMISLSKVG